MSASLANSRAESRRQRVHNRSLLLEQLEDRRLLSAAPRDILLVDPSKYESSEILVRFRSDQDPPADEEIFSGSRYAREFPLVPGLREVELADGVAVEQALSAYRKHPSVLYAEPNYHVQIAAVPQDPGFGQLWGLDNNGQNGGTLDADIDAPEAWTAFPTAAATAHEGETVVAVIDTGVDYTHPDLAANMWSNPAETPGNGIDDDENGFIDDVYGADFLNLDGDPMDDNGHGTHVAGTIAAIHDNGQGVAGASPNAKIMALKFLGKYGSGPTASAVAALDYAVAHGAKISNNSWGGGGFSQSLSDAIARAEAAGHLVVAAAGNSNVTTDISPSYPAAFDFDNIIAVAATDHNDAKAGFSNFGKRTVDLGAPGVDILSTLPGNTYGVYSGTSMAAPHVTGVAALAWSRAPDASPADIKAAILHGADPVASMAGITQSGRRLNAYNTLAIDPTGIGPRIVGSSLDGSVAGPVSGVELHFNEPIDPATFTVDDVQLTGPNGDIAVTGVRGEGSAFTISFQKQSALGTYTLVVGPDIRDRAGNRMDQDDDLLNGEDDADRFTGTFSIALGFAANDGPLPILDRTSVVSSIDIQDDIAIADLDVRVDIAHTWDRDLRLYLVGPGDDLTTGVLLSDANGGSGDGYLGTIFSDEARLSIMEGAAPFSKTYRPQESLGFFDGRSARGRWSLLVEDQAAFDEGQLIGWSLMIQPADTAAPDAPPSSASGPNLATGKATSRVTAQVDWTTVPLDGLYTDPVVVASPNYGAEGGPAVVRVRDVQPESFQFQVVTPGGAAIDGVDVYYMVVEAGVYNQAEHGVTMEALKVDSTRTDGQPREWNGQRQSYRNAYVNPVVFGQVMTANDRDWSVFWSRADAPVHPPSASDFSIGKHRGEDPRTTRFGETIGYVVFEAGSGTLGEIAYEVALGSNTVQGVTDGPPYSYTHGLASPTGAVVSQAGMNGLNGSWGLLYGPDPLEPNRLMVAVDEDQRRDAERNHIPEQLAYLVFGEATSSDSPELRTGIATSVLSPGTSWTTVALDHRYADPVVVATANYGPDLGPAVIRIRNAQDDSFEFQVVTPGGNAIDQADVYYMVVEAGVYNQAEHGITMEARKIESTMTDRPGSWVGERQNTFNTYVSPVVFGQVMTANDSDWSVFWSRGSTIRQPPSASDLYVGKHVGEDPRSERVAETIGYIVFEAGRGTLGDTPYDIGLGDDVVQGIANAPFTYSHAVASPTVAILSQAAMHGLNGSWGLLYGSDPVQPNRLAVAVDEDQLADPERQHIHEQLAYAVFGLPPAAGQEFPGSTDGIALRYAPSTGSAANPEQAAIGLAGTGGTLDGEQQNRLLAELLAWHFRERPEPDSNRLPSSRVDEDVLEMLAAGLLGDRSGLASR